MIAVVRVTVRADVTTELSDLSDLPCVGIVLNRTDDIKPARECNGSTAS